MSNPWADVQNGSLTSRYLYTRAVDEVFARLADDLGQLDLSWYVADRLGSVRQQVKTDGTVLNEINYDSFGNILTETNPAEGDRFKFTGREYDDLTDLYYYRARWYDANTGKFLSEDPLGFAAGDYNLSLYVGNDPINATDPSGQFIVTAIVVGGLIALDYYIWSKNAKVADDLINGRNVDPGDLITSGEYWVGATIATAYGVGIAVAFAAGFAAAEIFLPVWAVNAAAYGIAGYFVYEEWAEAWKYYQQGDYFQAGFHFLALPAIFYAAWKYRQCYRTQPKQINRNGAKSNSPNNAQVNESNPVKTRASDPTSNPKKVPNPWGRRGRPAHQRKAEQIAEQLREKGLRVEFEYAVKVQGGKTRYLDVAGIDPATNKLVEGHQIGRTLRAYPKNCSSLTISENAGIFRIGSKACTQKTSS